MQGLGNDGWMPSAVPAGPPWELAGRLFWLGDPDLDGDRATFDVRVLEGDLAGIDGPGSLSLLMQPRSAAQRANCRDKIGPISWILCLF